MPLTRNFRDTARAWSESLPYRRALFQETVQALLQR